MALVNIILNSGVGKSGRTWYQAKTVAGKYVGEPVFISELEYDYLSDLLNVEEDGRTILDEEEADK